mgnify:CR=1 FL=1
MTRSYIDAYGTKQKLFWNITKAPPDKQNSCFGQLVKKSHILVIYDNNALENI